MLTGPAARRSPSETNYVDCAGETVPCAVFSYVRTDHTVTKVSRSEYDACSGSDATSEDNSSGLTTVTLATPGMHYFICTTPDHCAGGMKLAVNVSATTTASSGSGGGLEVTAGANAGGGLLVPVPVMASVAAAAATGALRSSNRAWAAVTDRAQPPAAYADGDSASACQGTDTVHLFMSRTPILV
ncbi:uclacyanin-2 isoform X3 [Sorghum bicolor]|uniref:uclacyanin-2 isoform X3 n=1 Tax=Sorghum bicolor TaxID=4558 RepID=UPI000B4267B8|nr:uclacyanin-2 isoform X3 [Sorghum bicolor]|eukprot:XP_021310200.1 uclacyanin-2 isoform X3 [Sorghum bicolor]